MKASEEPLRICFFAHWAGLAGAERALLELVTFLVADYGVRALVVVPAEGALVERLRGVGGECLVSPAPCPWWCVPRDSHFPAEFTPARLLRGARILKHDLLPAIRAFDPAVIYTQTSVVPWGAAAAALLGKPHAWMLTEHVGGAGDLDFILPPEAVRADMLAASGRIFVISKGLAEEHFPAAPAGRIEVVKMHFSDPLPGVAPCPPGLYRRPGATRLAIFGGLSPLKGQSDAIGALARLVGEGRDVELLLAGPSVGSYPGTLAELAASAGVADRVHFAGELGDPFPAMRAADVILVCSRSEGFGRVPLEALLLERPLVYSLAGDYLETFPSYPIGCPYPPGDVEALARAIGSRLDDPARAASQAAAGRGFVLATFTREGYGGRIHRALRDLAEHGPAAVMPMTLARAMAEAEGASQSPSGP